MIHKRSLLTAVGLAAMSALLLACGSSGDTEPDAENGLGGDQLTEEAYVILDCPGMASSHAATEIWGEGEPFGLGEGGLSERVDNAHRFREIYLALNPNAQDEPPEIDFHEEQVLMVAYGLAPNLGYETVVERIAGDDSIIRVDYLTVIPGLGCVADDAVGYPYCLVSIEATERDIEFVGREEVRDCD